MKFKNNKAVVGLILIIITGLALFGSKIPVVNKFPLFTQKHEHEYKPVMDEDGAIEYWTCAMHPSVRLDEPGQCPICGMDLTSVEKPIKHKSSDMDNASSQNMHDHSGHGTGVMPKKQEDGQVSSEFIVSPQRQQMIGVKTEIVSIRSMNRTIRTVGKVELDETKIEHIHTKVSGWIDKVFVDFTWKHVMKGDPLFSIYSPDLVSTQQEYLLALKSENVLGKSEFSEISGGAKSLAEATRRRLKLWDISESQIRELERTGKVKKSLVIYSPITGHVSFKNAFENMYVEPKTTIFTIADHSTAWVNADIYEDEISLVKPGQHASITVTALPGEAFHGQITFVWPHLMKKTRTSKARLEFPNPDLKLLPEMFADVTIEIPSEDKLSVPTSAVLRTGKQNIVFVDKGEGALQIRKVKLGQKSELYYEVLKGLKEGDRVVTSANFLIDSESKVRAAVATWGDDDQSETTEDIKSDNHESMK